jgi:sortase (surface protein transpeptidase)
MTKIKWSKLRHYYSLRRIVGAACILVGLGLLYSAIATHRATPLPLTKVGAPDLTQPSKLSGAPSKSATASYSAAPTLPKYISIPAITIPNTEVLSLGLTANNAIAVPASSYVTGWYKGSARPGQQGAMFIYGHVLGWNAGGIFYNLKRLIPGDDVMVTRGDNTVYTYQVVSSKVYPAQSVDMSAVLSPIVSGTPGLNLMTCTGSMVPGSNPVAFTERLVVFTKLISKG